jgi:hypothetical protein
MDYVDVLGCRSWQAIQYQQIQKLKKVKKNRIGD